MDWRRWLVPGLVFTVLGAIVAGACLFLLYTDPAYVRQLVQEKLGVRFNHVAVSLSSARLRLLGGIIVNELRLSRSDALQRDDFLYSPTAVFLHDKEQVLDGKVLIRRVELNRPQVRIIRGRDGQINVADILAPSAPSNERMPTVVIRGGTISFEDRLHAPGVPLLELRDVNLTLVNDPLPVLEIEGAGHCDVLGPVRFKASLPRDASGAEASIRLPEVPVGPNLVRRLGIVAPEAERHLAGLTGRGSGRVDITYDPKAAVPLVCRASAKLTGGTLQHPALPGPLERIELSASCVNRHVPEISFSALLGQARLSARVTGLPIPSSRNELEALPEAMRELLVKAENVPVGPALLARLPEKLQFIQADYAPRGPATVEFHFKRRGAAGRAGKPGKPLRQWTVRPLGVQACFSGFPYALSNLTGSIVVRDPGGTNLDIETDVAGYTGAVPVTVKGHVRGNYLAPEVHFDIKGNDVPLDQKLFLALGETARKVAERFLPEEARRGPYARPIGRADVHAAIRRRENGRRFRNVITAGFKGTSVMYDEFPYQLSDVSGTLVLHHDHWEAKGFQGTHNGGVIRVSGSSTSLPARPAMGAPDVPRESVKLTITGQNIRLDKDFEAALVPRRADAPVSADGVDRKALQKIWRDLGLTGTFRFAAVALDGPEKPPSVQFALGFDRCAMKPGFFPYALEDVTGEVRYSDGNVHIKGFTARHGPTAVELPSAVVQPRGDGHFMVWLTGLRAEGLRADSDLLAALPEALRRGLEAVRPSPSFGLAASVTLDVVATAGAPVVRAWWKGGVSFERATLRAGTDVTEATGQFHCAGHFDGQKLHHVQGQLGLARASVLGQPLTNVTARLEVQPSSPETLRFRDLRADLFGGTLGGQAAVVTSPSPRYGLELNAVNVRLEQFGRHNIGQQALQGEFEGPVQAHVRISGEGDDPRDLRGTGKVDVADGKMGQLPLVLDLFKALGLSRPDGTAFEQMHMEFGIDGPRLNVHVLDLKGRAISLRGGGGVNLDGDGLKLDFTAMPGVIGWLPGVFSRQLLKVTVRGKLGKGGQVKLDKELVPAVLGPLRGKLGK